MNQSQLQKMIETIVRVELKKILPEVLGEMFIRKIVAEQVGGPAPRRTAAAPPVETGITSREALREHLRRRVIDDDDETFDDFAVEPETKFNEVASRLLSNENPMRSIYEGVSLDEGAEPDVPLSKLGFNMGAMSRLNDGLRRVDASRAESLDHAASAERAKRIAESRRVG